MDPFTAYHNEFLTIQKSLNQVIDQQLPQTRGEERKSLIRRTYRDLDEADEIVEQLQLSISSKSNAKQNMLVRTSRGELKSWRTKLNRLEQQSERDILLLSTKPDHSSYNMEDDNDDDEGYNGGGRGQEQRQRLLNSTQTLGTSSNRLDNAQRLAYENEEIGQSVLNSLVGQRIQLQGANESLEEADQSVTRAGRTIQKMIRTAYRQRITIGIFIVVLVTLIGLILWRKLT